MLSLVLLAVTAPAHGSDGALPWSGGAGRTTSFELKASEISSSLVGATVSVECVEPRAWRALGVGTGFDPSVTWALTPLARDSAGAVRPGRRTRFSPLACRLSDAFSATPTEMGTRICRHGTAPRRTTTLGRAGGPPRTDRVAAGSSILGECDGWGSTVVAVHVLAHESMHLASVVDEAVADCLALQVDALVAGRLGANAAFARSLAREYWRIYYPSQDARYRSARCRDGGALDLFRDRDGWPTPTRYPGGVARLIASFSDAARTATSLDADPPDRSGA